ncbi:MAG: hypothetical protein MUC38_14190 [Cyclobacteriaceae bacterium]|nr:hypothetical protein [Cyclobacteriaceae bacterium]
MATAVFTRVIYTRELRVQAEQIKQINEHLEALVRARPDDLPKKNKALEEYTFINAHRLRAPVASILGCIRYSRRWSCRLPQPPPGSIFRNR